MQLRLAIVGIVVAVVASVSHAQGVPEFVSADHAGIVAAWLAHHPQFRLATDQDCTCDDDLRRVRTGLSSVWNPDPQFHPYYVVGDFNGDGTKDFAVGVVELRSTHSFRVVVFNGPFATGTRVRPAFVSEQLQLGQAMFFGPPRPAPNRLSVGWFESEGTTLAPRSNGYVLGERAQ